MRFSTSVWSTNIHATITEPEISDDELDVQEEPIPADPMVSSFADRAEAVRNSNSSRKEAGKIKNPMQCRVVVP